MTLQLPPLRERNDKHELIVQLWEQHREPEQTAGLGREVLALLLRHPWPGNVRQLSSVLQVALVMAEQQMIEPEHLPADFFIDLGQPAPVPAPSVANDFGELLQATDGNISQLARRLGVSRNTVYKRLREMKASN